ncbi:S1C family serine protease [Magnetococcus sp. PR-3]|uniref:S1C family serine protease n=1 Tax=Magnetococcus sp. PR-3 TaxID=3120355 RepID=UPI002FCE4DDA
MRSPSSRLQTLFFWAVLFLLAGVVFGPMLERFLISFQAEPRAVTARGTLADDERNTIDIFKAAKPSVVYITTLKHVRDYWTRNILKTPQGTGSGFVWDNQGHIVTNWHVVKKATEAIVRLSDQSSFNAVLVGASPEHDLAVLRIDAGAGMVPPLPIGESHNLQVGQKVFAIGNPFGLDHTLTTGVISALERSIDNEEGGSIEDLIQTDAAINPGNSGGPLLDSAGRLIGINTAIFSPSGAYAGIGFAVPVDVVNRVVPQLIAQGRYQRPSLGIRASDQTSEQILSRLDVEGILILGIESGSAADHAGLHASRLENRGIVLGDVIAAIGKQRVKNIGELQQILEQYRVGDKVLVTVWRQGETVQVPVILGNP